MKEEEQEQGGTDLGNRIQSTLNAEDPLGVSRDGFRDVDSGVGLALYRRDAKGEGKHDQHLHPVYDIHSDPLKSCECPAKNSARTEEQRRHDSP